MNNLHYSILRSTNEFEQNFKKHSISTGGWFDIVTACATTKKVSTTGSQMQGDVYTGIRHS